MKATNYQEYLVESDQIYKKTLAEMKLDGKAHQIFDQFVGIAHEYNRLMFQGDAYSRNLAEENTRKANDRLYAEIDKLYQSSDPADRASAKTAEEAIAKFSGEVRGPSVIQRLTVEPYYSKEEGYKPAGFASLAVGLGLGAVLASMWGGVSGLGFLQSIGLTLAMGLSAAAVLPTAVEWLGNQFSGKKPETPDASTNPPEKSQGATQEQQRSTEPGYEQIDEKVKQQASQATNRNNGSTTFGAPSNFHGPGVVVPPKNRNVR